LRYRTEIDGLRAVAITPVVLFHSGISLFAGGYVGVDVFFVISGFLITKLISDEMIAGTFRISNFYERRIRRILPCLFAVLVVSGIAASAIFMPDDLSAFCKSAVAAIFFASNIKFYREAGYFDAAADTKPLLHTWSLAVEEQFYIFFPVLLFALYKYAPRRLAHTLVPIALASLALSIWTTHRAPTFNFFLAPTRIWELFAGSFLALNFVPQVRVQWLREVMAAAGLGLILIAVFAYTEDTAFPGAAALLPVLGAALVIHSAQGTVAGRLLALTPVVTIGLISYSLYMWHWPIIVFLTYYRLEPLAGAWSWIAIAGSVVVAWLSWRFIERPFRIKDQISRRTVFASSAVAMGLATVAALAGYASHGWPGRLPVDVVKLAASAQDFSPKRQKCHSTETFIIPPEKSCVLGAEVAPTFAIWGDSHAVEFAYVLGEVAAQKNESIVQLSSSACPPALGYAPSNRPGCPERNAEVIKYLLGQPQIRTVFLASLYGTVTPQVQPVLESGMKETVSRLEAAGKQVVLIYPTPKPKAEIPKSLAMFEWRGRNPADFKIDVADFEHERGPAVHLLDALDLGSKVVRVRPADVLCDPTGCKTYDAGKALYFDSVHLSLAGVRYVLPLLAPYL
jgi:peptidoglycan/LPS O-acetylase OafA/YrhL